MGNKIFVTIPLERFEQLTRAEHEANQLKAIIDDSFTKYNTIDRNDVELLHMIYFGDMEVKK